MPSSFTPVRAVDMSNEKDWPAHLGMLDWDSTSIVFTKRSLIEFLKYTGTTVDPNFSNIGKLPRYVTFGKLSGPPDDASTDGQQASTTDSSGVPDAADGFKPTRRVRTVPGGPHTDIFSHEDEDDALSTAPPKASEPQVTVTAISTVSVAPEDEEGSGIDFGPRFKPTRRVRTNPGGNSSMANLWDAAEPEEFKPTRRVRQDPGGHDNFWNTTGPEEFVPTRRVRQFPGGQDNINGIF